MGLSVKAAEELISDLRERDIALGRDPNNWYTYENHVYGAAKAAKAIASRINGVDPEQAYLSALLHDISRTEERRLGRFHGILGYEKLKDTDENAARAALLHMFPWNKLPPYENCAKMFFDQKKDYDMVADYLKQTNTKDSDLLTQLADGLANKDGFVTLEQRARDFSERHGVPIKKEMIEPYQKLKAYFDNKAGVNVYNLFMKIPIQVRER